MCFREATTPAFDTYAQCVLDNARTLASTLVDRGVTVLTGGTDTPLLLVDLRPMGLTGAEASDGLEAAGLTANKNSVPGVTQPSTITSGLRLGSSAATARGLGVDEFARVGLWIADMLEAMRRGKAGRETARIRTEVAELVEDFPIYPR